MQTSELTTVVNGKDGRLGIIDASSQPLDGSQTHVRVELDNGQQIWVPYDLLEKMPDGSYYLPVSREQLLFRQETQLSDTREPILVMPVIEEELSVSTRQKTTRVRVTKKVHAEDIVVEEPGYFDEITVERIPRDQPLDGSISTYYDGDTLVIPIVEERIIVQKQMVLKEEVRITKQRHELHEPQKVTLRREEAVVERFEDVEEK